MSSPQIGILIPTHQRPDALARTLDAYRRQSLPPDRFRILVVDDGSADVAATRQVVAAHGDLPLALLEATQGGPAAARNRGLAALDTPLILFTGDDIAPTPELLAHHLAFHEAHPEPRAAALGLTRWDPELQANAFMRWLESASDVQFAYRGLQPGQRLDYRYFYTSNLSLKREALAEHRFDESFRAAAWEDMELGYRLQQEGLEIHYLPDALGHHWHPYDPEGFIRRCRRAGWYEMLLVSKHPALWRPKLLLGPLAIVCHVLKGMLQPGPSYGARIAAAIWRGRLRFQLGRPPD